MKIEVQNTQTKEVEVTLPYYSKNSICVYKVIDKKNIIAVEDWMDELSIRQSEYLLGSAFSENTVEITAEEFESKLAEVKQKINAL
jgi:hypothetical protein